MIHWIQKILPFKLLNSWRWGRLSPRAHRVRPLEGSRIRFVQNQEGLPLLIPVVNLSRTGIALLSKAFHPIPLAGETIRGELIVDAGANRITTPLCLKIVRHQGDLLGCQPCAGCASCQTDLPSGQSILDLKAIAYRFFRAEIEAMEMKAIPPEKLRKFEEGEPHWFFGSGGAELFFIVSGTHLVRFHLSFAENYLEGGMGKETLRYGRRTEEPGVLQWLPTPPPEKLLEASRFIAHITELSEEHRALLQAELHSRISST